MKGDHRAIRVLQFHGEESYGRSVSKAPRQQSWLVNLPNQSRAGGQVIYDARWFHLHKGRRETHRDRESRDHCHNPAKATWSPASPGT